MAIGIGGQSNTRIALGDIEIGKASIGDVLVYSSGSVVTYHVDTDTVYTEEVDSGASVLTPSSFKPSKSGYTFVGWRGDTTADGDVLSSKTMESEPITLYAVFSRVVTANFYSGNNKTHNKVTGNAYYNASGQTSDAIMTTPTGAGIDGWIWLGWSYWWTETANENVWQGNGTSFNVAPENNGITFYGLYQKTCTLTCISYNSTQTVQGTAYYNSAGTFSNASVTIPTGATCGWTWRGWSAFSDTSADASVAVSNGQVIDIGTSDGTIYGLYQFTITLSYDGAFTDWHLQASNMPAQNGTGYWNAYGNYKYPSFTLAANGFSRTNKNFVAWAMGSTGGTQYAAGNTVTLSSNATFYAVWQQVYTPYTIRETGDKQFNSFTWTPYTYSTGGYDYSANAYGVYVEAAKTGGNMAVCSYTATLPTQGCNWMRVKYDVDCDSGCGASIMDTQLISTDENGGLVGGYKQDQYAYFNISEDATSISFTIQTTSSAGYDEEGGRGFLNVDEIYFYYE